MTCFFPCIHILCHPSTSSYTYTTRHTSRQKLLSSSKLWLPSFPPRPSIILHYLFLTSQSDSDTFLAQVSFNRLLWPPLPSLHNTPSLYLRLTLTTTSEAKTSLRSLIVAPAWAYCSSPNLEDSPAPDSTTTLKPCLMSAWTPAGDSATLRSFWKISLGTPTVSCLYGIPREGKMIWWNSQTEGNFLMSYKS